MDLNRSRIKTSHVIIAQFIAIAIWMSITIIQWVNNPKGSPGLLIPLIVRSVEAFSIIIISGMLIIFIEKTPKKYKNSYARLFLWILVYFGAIFTNLLSIFLRSLIGYAPPRIEGYFFVQSLHFYIPLILVLGIYSIGKHRLELQIERENKLKAESLAQQAKWMMLRYQVNPHFLFNALNTIRALIGVDDENARKTVTEMSEYFRYSLSSEDKYTVTVEKEIKAVQNYLEIQKIRFQDKIKIEIKVSKNSELCLIPVFSIQTLVENAVKYGLKTTDDDLHIIVECGYINGVLDIIVKNSGRLVYTQNGEGTSKGIQNLKNRLGYLYPDKNTFSLFEKDGFVIAHISLKNCLK